MRTIVTFNRGFLKSQRGRMNRHPLARAGAYVMRIARTSIRRRRNRNLHSPEGTPPYSHVAGALPPFKRIGFKVDGLHTNVVIGMEGFGLSGPPVPGLQEHGGNATRGVFRVVGRRQLRRNFRNPRQGGLITRRVCETVHYPERPFMQPALERTIPRLPEFWANSLR